MRRTGKLLNGNETGKFDLAAVVTGYDGSIDASCDCAPLKSLAWNALTLLILSCAVSLPCIAIRDRTLVQDHARLKEQCAQAQGRVRQLEDILTRTLQLCSHTVCAGPFPSPQRPDPVTSLHMIWAILNAYLMSNYCNYGTMSPPRFSFQKTMDIPTFVFVALSVASQIIVLILSTFRRMRSSMS